MRGPLLGSGRARGAAAPWPLVLLIAFPPQAPNPHGPPRQPVRGPPGGFGPPRRLIAAQPRRLLPGQDGIPGGVGGRRCGLAPGAEVRLQGGYPLTKAPPRGYRDAIRGRSRRWMLPWFQHWSNHTEAPDGSSSVAAPGCSRCPLSVLSFQVREELEAQMGRFRELLGRNPTHVDGHQHVHVLPGAWVGGPRQGGSMPRWVGRCSQVGGRAPY